MKPAGDYPVRFAWEVHTGRTKNGVGDPTSTFAAPVPLWGGYLTDRAGTVVQWLGSDQQSTTATIRFRNYPTVKPLDQFTDPQSGEVWTVETVRRGANEVLADVYR